MTDSFLIHSGDVVSVEVPEPAPIGVVTILGPQGPQGLRGMVGVQTLTPDGITETFQLDAQVAPDSAVQVFRNGLAEMPGIGFTIGSDGEHTVVNFSTAPLVDDEVQVVYYI